MEFQLFHFTRMTGSRKILQNEEREWPHPKTWADAIRRNLEFFFTSLSIPGRNKKNSPKNRCDIGSL
jgi:hypothetical protein